MGKSLCAINKENKDLFQILDPPKVEKKEFGYHCFWNWHPNCIDGQDKALIRSGVGKEEIFEDR